MVKKKVLMAEGNLMMVKVDIKAGFVGDIDYHPEEQLCYVERGIIEFELSGKKRMLRQGDVQYVPANAKHQVKVIDDCTLLDVFTPLRKDLL
ncbi:cupin domain-containing protein [Salisediminibacterium beveridgei]|uniref:Putative pectin degradation protein n=1 Tax=Salisediminibacterium beveridgei TaxID=632773 RepID=A0A1D7QRK8_9BACI|nr:cupin domain-containing protein [Salisediminibacterium beveridgei]AOM81641.1 Putative pectin degradation protein [Salisediminibacterium beveridgei]